MSWLLFTISVVFYTLSQSANFKDSEGWKNKYKQPMTPAPENWYYKLFNLKYREKFPLSGSLLVLFTDKYHFFQFVFKLFICTAITFYKPLFGPWDALIYFVVFGMCFTIVYRVVR